MQNLLIFNFRKYLNKLNKFNICHRTTTSISWPINRIKWYQFWRWHLVKQYKKECEEAKQKFIDTFGSPTSKGNLSSLNNTSKVHIIISSSDE